MIDEIENAIVNRLQGAAADGTLGYRYGSCESYAGEIDDDRMNELANRAPAAWIVWAGDKFHRTAGGERYMEGTFVVLCAARSLRNQAAARHGVGSRVGAYQMVSDVVGLIDGRKFGLPLEKPLTLVDRKNLFSRSVARQFAAVYAVAFNCIYAVPRIADELDDFTAVAGDWQLPTAPPEEGFEADYLADPDDPDAPE